MSGLARVAVLLLGLVVVFGGVEALGEPLHYADDFEGVALDPFWSPIKESSGNVVFPSTVYAHSGSQCVQMSTYDSVEHKGVDLWHELDIPHYGSVSVWIYDTGAGVWTSNAFRLFVQDGDVGRAVFGVPDYDEGRLEDTYHTFTQPLPGGAENLEFTGIDRTQEWHKWSIETVPGVVTFSLDDQLVRTVDFDLPFKLVGFYMRAPDYRPAFDVYWDDFEITASPVPEPSTLALFAMATLALTFGWWRRRP